MLPSQTARSSSSRSHMYRRTRNRKLPAVIIALLILVGVGVVYKWWQGSTEPSPAQADIPVANVSAVIERPDVSNRTQPTGTTSTPVRDQGRAAPAVVPPTAPSSQNVQMGGALPPSEPIRTPTPSPAPEKGIEKTHASNPSPASESPRTPDNAPQIGSLAGQRLQSGMSLLAQNKPVEARAMLTSALESGNISRADADRIRTELKKLNQRMVFGPEVMAGDPFASSYTIEPNDSLAKLPRKLGLNVDWRFLQRINNITAPEKLRVGQKIKTIKGPFHAIVHKQDFRMDIFMGASADRVFVTSVMVGLGEYGATPEGAFLVKTNSKLVDPAWTNPRTGEHFASKDPNNPLGKYWIGLIGVSDNIRDLETYGIHGTIDPDSIGEMRSMGCIRLNADDVALVYELMVESVSRVEIHGEDYP